MGNLFDADVMSAERERLVGALSELTAFVYSDGYYALSENRRRLVLNMKSSVETRLDAVCKWLYEDVDAAFIPDVSGYGFDKMFGDLVRGGKPSALPNIK